MFLSDAKLAVGEESTKKRWVISPMVVMAIVSIVPFAVLFAYHALKFILFNLFPTVWNFYSPFFTPTSLFFLMNFIIFALFAMSHAQPNEKKASRSPASLLSPLPSPPTSRQESFPDSPPLSHLDSAEDHQLNMGGVNDDPRRDLQEAPAHDAQDSSPGTYTELDTDTAVAQNDGEADRVQQHEQDGAGFGRTSQDDSPPRPIGDGEGDDPVQNPLRSILSESSSKILADVAMAAHDRLKEHMEKPLPSVRFASRARGAAAMGNGEPGRSGSPLRISRPSMKRGETMEATWRAICEKKERAANMQQKQKQKSSPSGTKMKSRLRRESSSAEAMAVAMAVVSPNKAGGTKMRKEPSMRTDELNARIDAFISRFHEQIRIQRQQSLLDSYADRSGGDAGGD